MTTTREQILDAAERLFAEKGYNGVGIREITQTAGVNVASVHYHFGSKEELYLEMVARFVEPLNAERMRRIDAVLEQDPLPPFEELMSAFLRPVFEMLVVDRTLSEERVRLISRVYTDSGSVLQKLEERFFPKMRDRIIEAFEQYYPEMPPMLLRGRLLIVLGSLFGTIIQLRSRWFILPKPLGKEFHETLFDEMIHFAAAGFGAPSPRFPRKEGR